MSVSKIISAFCCCTFLGCVPSPKAKMKKKICPYDRFVWFADKCGFEKIGAVGVEVMKV